MNTTSSAPSSGTAQEVIVEPARPSRTYRPRVFRVDSIALNFVPVLMHDDPRHGSINGYVNFKCRCPRCKTAGRTYREARKAGAR